VRRTLIDLSGIFFTFESNLRLLADIPVFSPLIWFIGLDSIVQVRVTYKKDQVVYALIN